jgi:hypothetical protein
MALGIRSVDPEQARHADADVAVGALEVDLDLLGSERVRSQGTDPGVRVRKVEGRTLGGRTHGPVRALAPGTAPVDWTQLRLEEPAPAAAARPLPPISGRSSRRWWPT